MEDIFWPFQLLKNVSVYIFILGPIWLLVKQAKDRDWFASSPSSDHVGKRLMRLLIAGMPAADLPEKSVPDTSSPATTSNGDPSRSLAADAKALAICFVGLEGMYLTWGVLQEKIMTRKYVSPSDPDGVNFKDAQFLVLANRMSAFLVAGAYLLLNRLRQPRHSTPGYKYAFASLSNILSSWCQYEALKFVSFPTQVIGKATKIIPVMLLGKVIQGKTYPVNQYITASLISVGVALFSLARGQSSEKVEQATTMSGVILIVGYLAFDSFTGNWQARLFEEYKVSQWQMMCGVNLFSTAFTLVSELEQGSLFRALAHLANYPAFRYDLALISACSALGQCFIFFTIKRFGAVTFSILMTIRQAMAILLSCIIFGHIIKPLGIMGIVVIFMGLALRIYLQYQAKRYRVKTVIPQPVQGGTPSEKEPLAGPIQAAERVH